MKTSWNPLGRSLLLIAQRKNGQQSLRGGECDEDDGWSGHKGFTRSVLRVLTNDRKRTQLNISSYLLSRYEDDPSNFIKRVVTQDKT